MYVCCVTSEDLVHEQQVVRGRAVIRQVFPQAVYDGALREAIVGDLSTTPISIKYKKDRQSVSY